MLTWGAGSGGTTRLGSVLLASNAVRIASSGDAVQYPFRARTRTPGRFTRACSS